MFYLLYQGLPPDVSLYVQTLSGNYFAAVRNLVGAQVAARRLQRLAVRDEFVDHLQRGRYSYDQVA